jgi:hypothetical protein
MKSDRDVALAAIHAGVAALLTSRDDFSQNGSTGDTAALKSASQQVDDVLSELRGSR